MVYNALGGTTPGVRPEVTRARLEPGDRLLLCSDGLTDMVSDDELAGLLGGDLVAACTALVDAANGRGGRDNITAVVAAFDEV